VAQTRDTVKDDDGLNEVIEKWTNLAGHQREAVLKIIRGDG
jgi:hypothetical protein